MSNKPNNFDLRVPLLALKGPLSIFLTVLTLAFSLSAQAQAERPWVWQQSRCEECGLKIETTKPELQSDKVQRFLRALESKKSEITALYHSDPQEYNLLAHMAVGILGRESQFFTSRRYILKQSMPWAVTTLKTLRAFWEGDSSSVVSDNSRGPTQIKVVPEKIAQAYGITPSNLKVPENAAMATMGFLIEALQELKTRARKGQLEFITPDTYVDYLPYIYFGRAKVLMNRTANPDHNSYVQDMKKYMGWVDLYETDPTPRAAARSSQGTVGGQ